MKNIHFIGFILWFVAAFFGFKLSIQTLLWFDNIENIWKIIIIFLTSLIVLTGVYKIVLSMLLLVNKNHSHFNQISTAFSVVGISGIIVSYFYSGFDISDFQEDIMGQGLALAFGIFLGIILINGFVVFPKTLVKYSSKVEQ